MTRIKICGITNVSDALAAANAGADAIGFVFAPSPRRITPAAARQIVQAVPTFVVTLGVFRDAPLDEVRHIADEVGLDAVQLHGDESPEYCAALGRCVVKRFAVSDNTASHELRRRMEPYRVSGYLLDPGAGDGRTLDWARATGLNVRLVVAGGLTPENVRHAIRTLRPYAVDVSSGVESAPGRKDHQKIHAFVQAVRDADARCVA